MQLENVILSHLIFNEEYTRKTIPFIKEEYFQTIADKTLFKLIKTYVDKYNVTPSKEALRIDINNLDNVSEEQFKNISELVSELEYEPTTNTEFLVDQTENWCKDRAIYLGIMESIGILDNKNSKLEKDSIPQILSDALAVSFDTSIGHNYMDDYEARYKSYHNKEAKIPFDIDFLNKITKGGVEKKTLNAVIAGTGVGKSLFLCHLATSYYAAGNNVLYITMELSEEKVAQRIDANLLDIGLDQFDTIPFDSFVKKIDRVKKKVTGKLVIKEYAPGSASAANFRHLINELKLKQNFVPDIIIIDYLNICASSRLKRASSNSYEYLKSVAEELRGLGVDFNVPVWTAIQTNRAGSVNSDFGMEDTAESFGIPQTLDFYLALISDENLYRLGQLMIKQLKSRYNDINLNLKFVIGIDRMKMRLYDVEDPTAGITNDAPVMDNTPFKDKDNQKFIN